MIFYNKIDLSEGIDVAKNNSKECIVCHYWYFDHGFKYHKSHKSLYNGFHDLVMLFLDISDIAIITVKGADYCYIVWINSPSFIGKFCA